MSLNEQSFREGIPANVAVLKINPLICILEVLGLHLDIKVIFLIFNWSRYIFIGDETLRNQALNFSCLTVSKISFLCFISVAKLLFVANKIRNFTINVAFKQSNEVKILAIYSPQTLCDVACVEFQAKPLA